VPGPKRSVGGRLTRFLQVVSGLLLLGVVLAVALFVRIAAGGSGGPWHGSPMAVVERAPDFTLSAHDGRVLSLGDHRGRAVVLFFGFTHCPDVCPLTMASLARAMELLGPRSAEVQVLFVSVDPQRDTAGRLATYLGNFHPAFLGITGSEEAIRAVATAYGAFYQRRELEEDTTATGHEGHGDPGGGYLIDHSGRTFVVDPRGRLVLTFPPGLDGERMAEDLLRVLGTR
jgi:protein SCO1